MNQTQPAVGTRFVLYWGPTPDNTRPHMYFVTYAEWYEKVYRHDAEKGPLQHPTVLAVPLGAVLAFDQLETRSHDEQTGMGHNGIAPYDQIQRVTYTTQDDRFGLLLPQWTKTLTYEGFETIVTRGPAFFLPFPHQGLEPKVRDGKGTIVALPVTADSPALT